MYNSCVNLRIRSKKGKKCFFCVRRKAEIERKECFRCNSKEYKKVSKIASKTRLKSYEKKHVSVSKKTYDEVYKRDNSCCRLCGRNQELQLHHINGRGKDKTNNPNNCIILCRHCHLEVVHKNNKYWRTKLNELLQNKKE